jgi:hypothetical protein
MLLGSREVFQEGLVYFIVRSAIFTSTVPPLRLLLYLYSTQADRKAGVVLISIRVALYLPLCHLNINILIACELSVWNPQKHRIDLRPVKHKADAPSCFFT